MRKTATFYETPFERILNDAKGAADNKAGPPDVVTILRTADAPAPSVSNLAFGVTDVDKVVAKAVASGGTKSRETNVSATSGAKVGFVKDPAGNEIHLPPACTCFDRNACSHARLSVIVARYRWPRGSARYNRSGLQPS